MKELQVISYCVMTLNIWPRIQLWVFFTCTTYYTQGKRSKLLTRTSITWYEWSTIWDIEWFETKWGTYKNVMVLSSPCVLFCHMPLCDGEQIQGCFLSSAWNSVLSFQSFQAFTLPKDKVFSIFFFQIRRVISKKSFEETQASRWTMVTRCGWETSWRDAVRQGLWNLELTLLTRGK